MLKQILHFSLLILIAIVIWFVGPSIAINGIPFLKSPFARLLSILLITLSWGCYYFFLNIQKESSTKKSKEKQPAFTHTGNTYDEPSIMLARHFEQVKTYCNNSNKPGGKKKHSVFGWRRTHKTSVHLVLGTSQSGKSHLLQQSSLNMKVIPTPIQKPIQTLSSNHPTQEGVIEYGDTPNNGHNEEPNDISYWYIQDDHVFLDTPGNYASSEVGDQHDTPWKKLLNLLHSSKKEYPITSLIITINSVDLALQQKQQAKLHIHLLKQRILELRKLLGKPLPLYIVITKCDLINGFREYFDDLSQDERSAPLGIALKHSNHSRKLDCNKSMTDAFRADFDDLLQKINALMISRLHQEHNPDKRDLMKELPLQLDRFKELFANVVYHLGEKNSHSDAAHPQGIYFTSSEQIGTPMDMLNTVLNSTFGLNKKASTQLSTKSYAPNKAYFIHQLLKKITQEVGSKKISTHITPYFCWKKISVIGAASLTLIISTFFMIGHFKNDLLHTNKTAASIRTYQLLKKDGHSTTNQHAAQLLLAHYKQASAFWVFNRITPKISQTATKTATITDPQPLTFLTQLKHSLEPNCL